MMLIKESLLSVSHINCYICFCTDLDAACLSEKCILFTNPFMV